MNRKFVIRGIGCTAIALAVCSLAVAEPDKKEGPSEIRVAVFNLEAPEGFAIDSKALTDQVTTILSSIETVRLVERAELSKAADEHKIALSGLADANTAAKLGKFVNAQYIVVGKGSRISQSNHIALKFINVETTGLTIVAAKAAVEDGADKLVERLETKLSEAVAKLKKAADAGDASLAELRKLVTSIVPCKTRRPRSPLPTV
jgi:hypothetical protein